MLLLALLFQGGESYWKDFLTRNERADRGGEEEKNVYV